MMLALPARLTRWLLSASLLLDLVAVSPAFPWYDKGHRVVALIAQANLSPETRKQIEGILPAGTTLADAAVWPDHEGRRIGDFDSLHYVSIPDNADGYNQARDCPQRNCMVEAIRWFLSIVADKNAPLIMSRIALRYIAHIVGDMHQPLHAGRATDRGGTDIAVSFKGATTNLHFFWDTDLVEMEEGDAEEVAMRLNANVTEQERRKWQAGDPKQWTDESLILVRSHAYHVRKSVELTDEYVEKARPIVRTRLVQAGIRLAWLLNTVFK